jgi:invasion protein IalB
MSPEFQTVAALAIVALAAAWLVLRAVAKAQASPDAAATAGAPPGDLKAKALRRDAAAVGCG